MAKQRRTEMKERSANQNGKPPFLLAHDKTLDTSVARNAFDLSARPYNPKMDIEFQKALLARDVDGVRAALDAGVNPNRLVGDMHPLMILLYNQHDGMLRTRQHPMGLSAEQYNLETTALVEMLMEEGVSLCTPGKYRSKFCRNLMDHLLVSGRAHDIAYLIPHAIVDSIKRTGHPYEIDRASYVEHEVMAMSERTDDAVKIVSTALIKLEQLHETVGKRLQDPSTHAEWELSVNLKGKLGSWGEAFSAPVVENFLPLNKEAGQEKTAAEKAMDNKVKKSVEQMQDPKAGEIDPAIKGFITVLEKRNPADVMADIMALTGNDKYKEDAETEILDRAMVALRAAHGLHDEEKTLHMALTGATGTGKTTLARLDAEYLYAIGFGGPYFAEVSRTKLMQGHIGATDVMMQKLLSTAHFVFIDEAPQLSAASQGREDKQDFGHRVIEAVIPAMENNRDSQVFYFAGYTKEMDAFLSSDKGLRGRIGRTVHIEDPSRDLLSQALTSMLDKRDLKMSGEAREYLLDQVMEAREKLGEYFSNYRAIRTVTENLRPVMARRLLAAEKQHILGGGMMAATTLMIPPSKDELMTATLEDVKKLDLAKILGTISLEKAKSQEVESKGYQNTGFGFTGTLKNAAKP